MKRIKKFFKWLFLIITGFFFLIILSGLIFNGLGPEREQLYGKLVDIGDFRLHVHVTGEKSEKPTLVMENGSGLPTEFFYWINEHLKDSLRIVRYDRAGLGYSDECITPRDPETVAKELHRLLNEIGEKPPYIMMGHSIGGPYVRVFTELYPEEVAGMFLLDATHPDHPERYDTPKESDFIFKAYAWSIGVEAFLADMGVVTMYDNLIGTPYFAEGLPDAMNDRVKDLLRDGKSFRAFKKEVEEYFNNLKRSGEHEDFGDLPIRVFEAVSGHPDPEGVDKFVGTHKEFKDLSTNGKQIDIISNHVTIFSKKENAKIICNEVLSVIKELGY